MNASGINHLRSLKRIFVLLHGTLCVSTPLYRLTGMEILIAHNFYKHAGGENGCVAAELAMLQAHGHRVNSILRFQ